MGLYLNPGNMAFRMVVRDDIYVDKTKLISYTNSKLDKAKRYICVSRPRRFGKSMAANMLASYYGQDCDSLGLFQPYKIAEDPSFKAHLNQYNVIFLNMQQMLSGAGNVSGRRYHYSIGNRNGKCRGGRRYSDRNYCFPAP